MHKRRGESPKAIMDIKTALYHVAHDHPGGVPALAACIGVHPGTLQNMLDIGSSLVEPSLKVFRLILQLTRDDRIIQAVTAPVGYVGIRIGDFDATSDLELLDAVNRIVQRVGQTTGDLSKSLEDGRISPGECADILGDIHRAMQALQELGARVTAITDPAPAANVAQIRPGGQA